MDKTENKFNFSEDEEQKEQAKVIEESKEKVANDAKGLVGSVRKFMTELLDFRHDTDRDTTVDAIKGDVAFKGATAWILICSIFVASVGLNANSTAVVIGAMLISPLMGPILGIGMSIAINDIDTLRKSLINLATMIVLSLLTAFLFFWLFPLSEDTSELLGRTRPDIRDVLIAFFGGLALIIARTKKGTIASVIFGVAIATALMPPLCTAGYGLAIGNLEYFLGAMYLFGINTIFIAIATFLVLKLLRFPMLKYANSTKRRRIARLAGLLAIIAVIPAGWTFVNVLKESNFNNDAKAFIEKELEALPNSKYIKSNATFVYRPNDVSYIELRTFGSDEIPQTTIDVLQQRFTNYSHLKSARLNVNQASNRNLDQLEYMEELRYRDSLDIMSQQEKIRFLEDRVARLTKLEKDQIPFRDISKEARILFDKMSQLSYSQEVTTDFDRVDTLSVFSVKWIDSLVTPTTIDDDSKKLADWLKVKLDLDTLVVKKKD